eukprot:15849326-Heterocapsa_arctica.AAC.1
MPDERVLVARLDGQCADCRSTVDDHLEELQLLRVSWPLWNAPSINSPSSESLRGSGRCSGSRGPFSSASDWLVSSS